MAHFARMAAPPLAGNLPIGLSDKLQDLTGRRGLMRRHIGALLARSAVVYGAIIFWHLVLASWSMQRACFRMHSGRGFCCGIGHGRGYRASERPIARIEARSGWWMAGVTQGARLYQNTRLYKALRLSPHEQGQPSTL